MIEENTLGRVYNPNRPGKERDRFLKVIIVTINKLHNCSVGSDEFKDISAFLLLSTRAVTRSIETTTTAWEKRGYWIKADRFRLEWSWLDKYMNQLDRNIQNGEWDSIVKLADEIHHHLGEIPLLKKHRFGKPWLGAYKKYKKM